MIKLAVVVGAFASFGGFLFGYDTGYISGLKEMPYFLSVYGELQGDGTYILPSKTDSLITSILSAGTFFGALLASTVGDYLGRRKGIMAYIAVFCVGVALQTGGKGIGIFAGGRVLAGLGVGGTSCLVPLYQAECAPKHIRGMLVSAYQWCITIGLLIAACVVKGTKNMNGSAAYQIPVGIQFVWAAILVSGLAVLPESPRWLLTKDRSEEARRSLSRLLGEPVDGPNVIEQYDEIAANLQHERAMGHGTWGDCFKMGESRTALRVLTGMATQALQQLSGINFIIYYGTSFFSHAGISDPFLITIAINLVNVGMTVPGMIAADRVGRRSMLIYGAAGMAVAQLVVAAVGVATPITNMTGQKVLVAFVCIYIGHFASTWAVLAWVVTSEMYPLNIRSKGMSLSTATNWLFNFAIGYSTPYLVNTGPGNAGLQTNVFWIWGGFCVIATVFSYFCIPETKQLSLEQVDLLWRNSTPLKSNAYRKHLLAENIHERTNDPHASFSDKMEVHEVEREVERTH